MNKIYADTEVCSWYLTQLGLEILPEITADNPAVFHMPYPYDAGFEIKIERAVAICPKIVVLVSELHAESTRFIVNHQHPRIKYFVCGFVEGYSSNLWMDWFITTTDFYKHNDLLDHLTPYKVKPKVFDVLLGWNKPHRQKIYDYLLENKLTHRVILTYLQDRSLPLQKQLPESWIWPEITIPKDTVLNTISRVKYKNNQISLSQIIPADIYNQSSYTIVAETNWHNHYSFYTEKIVKPILAQRLFIVFSGQHYLRNLRRLGFKTFNGIIDETYDSIGDSEQRFSMALKQMHDLIDQPQDKILAKIQSITEHNKRIMLETDWYGDFARELREFLLDHTS